MIWDESSRCREALSVLAGVSDWHLAETDWERLREVLGALRMAVADGDSHAVDVTARRLDWFDGSRGPVRLGTVPRTPPPQDVLERIGELVHSLSAELSGGVVADADEGGVAPRSSADADHA
ncbi:CATRA system-associated protein [Streptomyces sp. NPDC058202]|uniref:CATRA system-associated protein n=1 Tax=Streptomyces sp. NPDC058202 TaxID=3346380 RepID=UPI0036E78B77